VPDIDHQYQEIIMGGLSFMKKLLALGGSGHMGKRQFRPCWKTESGTDHHR
jgi:hypothetical protein